MLEKLVSLFAAREEWHLTLVPFRTTTRSVANRMTTPSCWWISIPIPRAPSPAKRVSRTITLPAEEPRWLESRHRYLALAKIIQINAPEGEEAGQDRDATAAEVAKAVGRAIIVENRLETGKFPRAVVRCVRRMSQPRLLTVLDEGFPPDPTASAYDILLYTADVFIAEDGQTVIVKGAARNQQAPLQPNLVNP